MLRDCLKSGAVGAALGGLFGVINMLMIKHLINKEDAFGVGVQGAHRDQAMQFPASRA